MKHASVIAVGAVQEEVRRVMEGGIDVSLNLVIAKVTNDREAMVRGLKIAKQGMELARNKLNLAMADIDDIIKAEGA